jgi:GGDEF domain-containing protein
MLTNSRNGRLSFFMTVLGVWLLLSSLAVIRADPNTPILALALLAVTTTMGVTDLFPLAGLDAAVIGAGLYAGIQVLLLGVTVNALLPAGVVTLALLIAALLSALTVRQVSSIGRQLERAEKLIEGLRMYDPETELVKSQYVRQTLEEEIARSQRYNKQVGLLFIQISDASTLMQRQGVAGMRAIQTQIAGILKGNLRGVDVPFVYDSMMGVVLPETNPAGVRVVAERLVKNADRKVQVAIHVGAAHFPSDALTAEELLHSAEAALQVSLTSGQPIVFHIQLRSAVQDGKKPEAKSTVGGETLPASPAPPLTSPAEQSESRDGRLPRETPWELGIVGLRQFAETVGIEKALQEYPGVEKTRLVRYSDGVLVMEVTGQPDRLVQALPSLIGLPVQDIRAEDGRIEVRLAETRDEKTAGPKSMVEGKILPASPAPPLTLPVEQPETRVGQLPRAIWLGIVGLRQFGETARIEKAIREYPGVEKARPGRYSDGALIMEITAQPDRLVQVLPSLIGLPVQGIRTEDGWIEVRLAGNPR